MLVLAALGVLLAMTVSVLLVVSAVVASHRAHAAADLAALAAAAAVSHGEGEAAACDTGSLVAARNGATVASCRAGPDRTVEVVVRVLAPMPHVGAATARARAGPAHS